MKILGMKTVKRGIIFLAIIAMILFSNLPKAIAGDYIGEICLSAHITEDAHPPADEVTRLFRAGVTYMGGAYYLLQGFTTIPNNNPVILEGTAVIVGNEVFVTLNGSEDDSSELRRDGTIAQMRLAISTLSGTIWGISDSFNTVTREFTHGYFAGTVTLTTCP